MFKRVLKWLLKSVDIDVDLSDSILTVKLYFAGVTVAEWSFHLGAVVDRNVTFREFSHAEKA